MAKKAKARIINHPIEMMGESIKKSAWSSTMVSLATLLLGILFIAWPDVMIQAVAYIIGAIFITKGVFDTLIYFMDERNVYTNLLLSGVVSTIIGILALVAGPNIANVFRIIIGIFLIYESLVKFNSAIKLHYANINLWRVVVVLALIILVLGIFITFNDTASVIGWAMVFAGVVGIIGDVMFIQQVDKVTAAITSRASKK